MPRHLGRRHLLGTALSVTVCGWAVPARACEVLTSTLRVLHPWTRATVAGADTAVLCMTFDEVHTADRLVGVRTPIATGARLAGTAPDTPLDLPIPQGSTLELHEDGTHLLLTGLHLPLQVGRAYPLELQFEQAGVALASLSVDFTAANASAMPSFPAFRFR
jgi:copper(I)-binding protein